MSARTPWTREELKALIPVLDRELTNAENEYRNVKPLPPMTVEECEQLHRGLLDIAGERALTMEECFMMGQILACYQSAVRAEMLGKKGRYFVVAEDQLNELLAAQKAND